MCSTSPLLVRGHFTLINNQINNRGTFTLITSKKKKKYKIKRNRGDRRKRKDRRGRETKGSGQLHTSDPDLLELSSPGNSFLLMTAPISVWLAGNPGSRELVSMESWRGREEFIHLYGWQKPDVLKSLR